MASEFSSAEGVSQGDDCKANAHVTYRVKEEKKKLGDDCSPKTGYKKKIRARKGGPNLHREKYDKDSDLYCKTHDVNFSFSCAMVDQENPCVRQDIDDAIMENKAKLNLLKEKAMEKLQLCRVHGKHIIKCKQSADEHLQSIRDDVDSIIEKAIARDKVRKQEDAAKINQEIEKRHEENNTIGEKRQDKIHYKHRDLHADIQKIAQEIERKIGEFEKSLRDDTQTTTNANQTLDTVLEDDQNILKDGHRVNTSVTDEIKKPLNEGEVEEMNRVVKCVRFVKGAWKEMMYDGRIDGYDGEWKLIDTIDVRNKLKLPTIVGCKDECNVIITYGRSGSINHTYMLNLNTKHRVIKGIDTSSVRSCAVLNDDKLVCSKVYKGSTGKKLTGCINVYDRQWKLINSVTLPRNTTHGITWVDVAADKDGMIIAAEVGQSKIYVINPADGIIINTITCKEKIIIRDILSSGHIIVQPFTADRRALIIDRKGAQREIPHNDVILNVCVDRHTDDIYVVTSDNEYTTCVIDQVKSGGDIKKRRVASFALSKRLEGNYKRSHLLMSRVMMTSSGKMIASNGDNIHVFKKLFSL